MSWVSVDRGSIELKLNGEGVRLEPELEGERISGPTELNKETVATNVNEDKDDSDFQNSEPEEVGTKGWVSNDDDDDDEIMNIRNPYRVFIEKKNRSVGDEDLELVVSLSGGLQKDRTMELNGEGIRDKTDFIGSNDVGSYDSDSNEQRVKEYLSDYYKRDMYQMLYNCTLPTIPSENFWKGTRMGPIDHPLKRKLIGRPKHKRKREEGTSANK
ncbi:hypothetical protein J1N35_034807 [Gossypium stocksii]|uniref:Uncharacterized protein n=1 Tax=Gossypium stocksii TaxID=47602 RepID=A0A9D3USQ8_9ROSI|nr:hypothetical protein J1N35_034807 [Gossypium stocksii]